jgi:formylglycine-generating enzyme required for sulfatase activity
VRPTAFVSLYQANDSCFSKGKRLCATDEWVVACSGPFGWAYPYGDVYEPNACGTQDTTVRPSGSRPECRGYFDVYDMSGNLAEWTNTRATRNPQFYNVKGGFWASGAGVTCRDTRYSYFPQNRHNPVGFRCCKDSEE